MEQNKNVYLSVVVPVFNGERYIKDLMESLDKQSFRHFEVIIVDDGSTDSTYEQCLYYSEQRAWVNVIRTENHGVSHARNTGLKAAKGDWVQFIDADDVIEPDMFADFAKAVSVHDTDLVVCGCLRTDLKTGTSVFCGPSDTQVLEEQDLVNFLDKIPMTDRYWALDYIWNKWFKREIILSSQIQFCETLSLGEDFVFNAEYFQHISSAVFLKHPYYQYRIGESGLVSKFQPEPWVGGMKLYEAQKKLCQAWGIWETNKDWIRCQAGHMTFGNIRLLKSPKCYYNTEEKRIFLYKFINSEQFSMTLEYLESQSCLKFKIYEAVLKSRSVRLINWLIAAEKHLEKFIN